MHLRGTVLAIDRAQFPDLQRDFSFSARYVSEYVSRAIRKLRFKTRSFDQVVIEGRAHSFRIAAKIVPFNTLEVFVKFDERVYANLTDEQKAEFYLAMLRTGMKKASRHFPIPICECEQAAASFRANGYRNVWVHQTKHIRALHLQASLICELDAKRFTLVLQVSRAGEVIYRKVIFRQLPSPVIYGDMFRDLKVSARNLSVRNAYDDEVFRISLKELALRAAAQGGNGPSRDRRGADRA